MESSAEILDVLRYDQGSLIITHGYWVNTQSWLHYKKRSIIYLSPILSLSLSYQLIDKRNISMENVFEWNVKFVQVITNINFNCLQIGNCKSRGNQFHKWVFGITVKNLLYNGYNVNNFFLFQVRFKHDQKDKLLSGSRPEVIILVKLVTGN